MEIRDAWLELPVERMGQGVFVKESNPLEKSFFYRKRKRSNVITSDSEDDDEFVPLK
jgi:hypothetical protein